MILQEYFFWRFYLFPEIFISFRENYRSPAVTIPFEEKSEFSPGISLKEKQKRENLQSSCQHIKYHNHF